MRRAPAFAFGLGGLLALSCAASPDTSTGMVAANGTGSGGTAGTPSTTGSSASGTGTTGAADSTSGTGTTTAGSTVTGGTNATGTTATTATAGATDSSGTTGASATTGTGTGTTGPTSTTTAGTTGTAATTGIGTASTTGTNGTTATSGTTGRTTTTGTGGTTATGSDGGRGATTGATTGSTTTGSTTGGTTGTCAAPTITLPTGNDAVFATPTQLNDNGAWCWYQDERALIDTKANKLLLGSVASGGTRNGHVEAVIYDLAAKTKQQYTLPSSLASSTVDDHNAPGFVIRPDGKYFAMWSGHRSDCISRSAIFDGTAWGAEQKFDWTAQGCPWAGASTNMVTYSNPWYLGTSIYSMVRSVGTDPGVLTSANDGQTWTYYGRLMDTVQVGYVAGYFKYWGNNTDRIDFVGTEAHPRDADTSLYHGYISGGKVYNSAGTVMDASLMDTNATTTTSVNINTYTPVLKTGASVKGVKMCRMWNHDIVRYADGTIAVLGQGRADNCTGTPSGSDPDKRMLYFRFDGTSWKATYLVKAGPKLYASEEDYTGLSALDPDDPHTIYISTTIDPRDDTTNLGKHELFRGTTCDNGATFTWTQLTAKSTMDNVRPIVPKWDSGHTALLWMRGTYSSAQTFAMSIVGVMSTK